MIVLAALSWAPIMPMLDAVAVEQSDAGLYDYGRVRIAGSVTFIAGSLGAGALLLVIGKASLIWLLLVTHMLHGSQCLCCCRSWERQRKVTTGRDSSSGRQRKVLMTGSFVLLIAGGRSDPGKPRGLLQLRLVALGEPGVFCG